MSGWRSRASQLISGAGRATQVCRESVPFFRPAAIPIVIRCRPVDESASRSLCWPFVFIMCCFPDKGLHSLIVFVFCDWSTRWQRFIRNASR